MPSAYWNYTQSQIKAANPSVKACSAATPYYNGVKCISCSTPTQYFNLKTR